MPASGRPRRRPHKFQPGNTAWKGATAKKKPSNSEAEHKPVASGSTDSTVDIKQPASATVAQHRGPAYNLRSSRPPATEEEETVPVTRNRLVDMNRVITLFNTAISQHADKSEDGHLPCFIYAKEKKWGTACQLSVKCERCDFETPLVKLYTEVDTGRVGSKPAETNIGLAVTTQNTSIGPTKVQILCAGLNMPVPCLTGMQRAAEFVSQKTSELNQRDMRVKLEKVRQPHGSIRNVSVDTRYNSSSRANRRKCGQSASQAIATAIETDSPNKYIVSLAYQNKLCIVGARLRSQGRDVLCPGNDHKCCADTDEVVPLSEEVLGERLGQSLAAANTKVDFVTSDGDARCAKGLQTGLQTVFPDICVERQADPTHLAESMKRYANSHTVFSSEMFPQCRTKAKKTDAKKYLINDMANRSLKIVKNCVTASDGDESVFSAMLTEHRDSIIKCYSGDCSGCIQLGETSTCAGKEEDNWLKHSIFLGPHGIRDIHPNEKDKAQLKDALGIMLSSDAAVKLRLGTNTQKNEAVNRAFSARAPKNVNFSRTFPGRPHATVLCVNNGEGEGLQMMLNNAGIALSPESDSFLKSKQTRSQYHKVYQNLASTKSRQCKSRARKTLRFIASKTADPYKKDQLDVPEHQYSQARKK